jgi:tetratricopeptide (TPR) repeat protein
MCPEDPIRPDRPDGSSEFHETDFYSQFQDQNGTLSEGEPKARRPRDEIDEATIQELMDAALQKGGAPDPPASEALDTHVREDWAGPAREIVPPKKESRRKPRARPARKPLRFARARPARRLEETRGARRNEGLRFGRRMSKFAALVGLLGLILWGVYTWGIHPRSGVMAGVARAAEWHASGGYAQAAELYHTLGNRPDTPSSLRTKLAFLRGGACEQLWRSGQDPGTSFERALSAYDEAIRLDRTELRVYAVEALLAKADALVEEARQSGGGDSKREREGWATLATLIDDPNYRMNPAVHHGVPHRRLAELMREENPVAAIELLKQARDAQGELEEGLENLAIASIYKDFLGEPDRAEEFFESVEQNELASAENRRLAEKALAELREGETQPDDYFPYDSQDVEAEWESSPEAIEP